MDIYCKHGQLQWLAEIECKRQQYLKKGFSNNKSHDFFTNFLVRNIRKISCIKDTNEAQIKPASQ